MQFSDREKLLRETIRNSEYEAFRSKTFQAGLEAFRSQRTARVWPRNLALAASVALLLASAWLFNGRRRHTETLHQGHESTVASFASVPLQPELEIRSITNAAVLVETEKQPANIEIIHSGTASVSELNDEQLLALFKDRPVGFLRRDGRAKFLIIGN